MAAKPTVPSGNGEFQIENPLFDPSLLVTPHTCGPSIDYELHPALFKLQVLWEENKSSGKVPGPTKDREFPKARTIGFYLDVNDVCNYDQSKLFFDQSGNSTFVSYEDTPVKKENCTKPPCNEVTFTLHWPFPPVEESTKMKSGSGPQGVCPNVKREPWFKGRQKPVSVHLLIREILGQISCCMKEVVWSRLDIVNGFQGVLYSNSERPLGFVPPGVIERLGGKPAPEWSWQEKSGLQRRLFSDIKIKENPPVGEKGLPSVHLDLYFHTNVGPVQQ